MSILQIDIETYSDIDIKTCGAYRYADSPDFEILLFAFAFDDDPVQVIDLTAYEEIPDDVISALVDPQVTKEAHNANFERVCLHRQFGIYLDPSQWRCTSVWARTLGLPGSLAKAAEALGVAAQKDKRGDALIKYFSVPCKPTKVNGGRTRNLPHHAPDKWAEYIEYNRQDVVVEREIRRALSRFPVPDQEWELWALDQRINDAGVRLDRVVAEQAVKCNEDFVKTALAEAREITGLENPNSLTQLKGWLADQGMVTPDGVTKDSLPELIQAAPDDDTRRVLEIRQQTGKTSVDKYEAMLRSVCDDSCIRGVFKFYGAGTGRWSGQIFQPQNLPQNKIPDLELARGLLQDGGFDLLEMLYGPPPFVLSQLVRTALIPQEGSRFIVSDFSAIEARVIAWLADEDWVLDVFRGHGKIYEATAAQMFKVPIETITRGHVNYELRARGKVATLACGYQGGVKALEAMGALKNGIEEDELQGLIDQWRAANKRIVRLWYAVEEAALQAVQDKTTVDVAHGVRYRYAPGVLFADLPSGRSLAYMIPRIKASNKFNKQSLVFNSPKKGGFVEEYTYGGKLVENLVQAIARDCLAESMMRLNKEGYKIVMHVHDEVVIEAPRGTGSLENVTAIMGQPVPWAPGLPLTAAAFECDFYQKD